MAIPSRPSLLTLLAAGNFAIGMGAFVVAGIITPIADGLAVSPAAAGMVMTAYAIAYAVASPIAVVVTGRIARRTVLCAALAIFLMGTIWSALASDLAMLIASRVMVAIGAALYTPAAAGLAVSLSTPEARGRALATVFGGLTLAQVAGVPVGAWLAYRWGWPVAFWGVAALAILGLVLLYITVPRQVAFQPASLATIVGTLKDWRTSVAIAITASCTAAIFQVFTYFGPIIEASTGHNPELRSLFLVLFGLGAVVGNLIGGFLSDRIGTVRTLALVCAGQAALLPLFSIIPWQLPAFALLVGVWSSFCWAYMAPQQARLAALAPRAITMVLALNAAMIYAGIAIGSAVSALVLSRFGPPGLGISGGIAALLALCHLFISAKLSGDLKAPANPASRSPPRDP